MDLFVVNRHEGDESLGQEDLQTHEKENFDKVLQRIEKNKKLREKKRAKERKLREVIEKTTRSREVKRQIKAKQNSFVPVPDNTLEEFIDDIEELQAETTSNEEESDTKKQKGTVTYNETDRSVVDHKEQTNDFNEVQYQLESTLGTDEGTAYKQKKRKRNKATDDVEGFDVLGKDNSTKNNKVKRVLPTWLTCPTIISANLENKTKLSEIAGLDKKLKKLLKSNGVKTLYPVQAAVIPWLLDSNRTADLMHPNDLCISAPTGSGKTLTYVLPVIHHLQKYSNKQIRALVIVPTQDLAKQVFKTFKNYLQGTDLHIITVTGEKSFDVEQKQIVSKSVAFGYNVKVDILVATPGRLIDHFMFTEGFDLSFLEYLIIDEADRVVKTNQEWWLEDLMTYFHPSGPPKLSLRHLRGERPPQKLIFSATLPQDPEKLKQLYLFEPKLFTSIIHNHGDQVDETTDTFIGKYTTPKELTEKYIETSMDLKPLALYQFVKQEKLNKTLIFTHSADSAHRLAILLKTMFKGEVTVEEISARVQSNNREKLLSQFVEGKIDLLISTDLLARGMDLPGVQCVISYSAPKYIKSYIHRTGRTARAGQKGLAVTFVHSSQVPKFKAMLKEAKKQNVEEVKILEDDLEPHGELFKESLAKLEKVLEKEKQEYLKKMKVAKGWKTKNQRDGKPKTNGIRHRKC